MSVMVAESLAADIRLRTPDNFMLPKNSSITAAGNVLIQADYADSDSGTGADIDLISESNLIPLMYPVPKMMTVSLS